MRSSSSASRSARVTGREERVDAGLGGLVAQQRACTARARCGPRAPRTGGRARPRSGGAARRPRRSTGSARGSTRARRPARRASAKRATRTVVLPVPAAPSTSTAPPGCVTARACAAVRSAGAAGTLARHPPSMPSHDAPPIDRAAGRLADGLPHGGAGPARGPRRASDEPRAGRRDRRPRRGRRPHARHRPAGRGRGLRPARRDARRRRALRRDQRGARRSSTTAARTCASSSTRSTAR